MSKYIALFLFALIGLSLAAPNNKRPVVNTNQKDRNDLKWWNDSKAAILTSRSFEGLVGKDKYVIVQFCATFSKECEALQPEYNKLAELYSGPNAKHPNVFIGKIDGWTFNSLSQTYSIKRFPSIRFFNKNDATNSDEYTGEVSADTLSKWIEETIKAKENPKAEEKKPEEVKKEEPAKEVPKEQATPETKQPEATNTQANEQQNNQQQQQQQQTQQTQQTQQQTQQPPKTEEDLKKEFKLVLNTTLLQAQFDQVQAQLNKLSESLHKSMADHFQKVESLKQAFEQHKSEFHQLSESLRHQGDKLHNIGDTLHHHKEEIKSSVTRHAEDHLNQLKDSVHNIKNKVHERKEEVPSGPGLLHNLIYIVIGCAVGAAIVVFVGNGKKKSRSMLD